MYPVQAESAARASAVQTVLAYLATHACSASASTATDGCVWPQWLRAACTGTKAGTSAPAADATEEAAAASQVVECGFSTGLRVPLTWLHRGAAAASNAKSGAGASKGSRDSTLHQAAADIERDAVRVVPDRGVALECIVGVLMNMFCGVTITQIIVNGKLYVGGVAGFEAIMAALVAAVTEALRGSRGGFVPSATGSSDPIQQHCTRFAHLILASGNRTSSGGDSFDAIRM